MNNALSIKRLKKSYYSMSSETIAIDNISFNLKENEIITLIGPSGCGKSTILSILAGIENSYDGKIDLYNNKIGYMLQNDCLFEWLTVFDNCLIGLKIRKILSKKNIDYVNSLLKKYNLYDFKDKFPRELSGGMRQRVA